MASFPSPRAAPVFSKPRACPLGDDPIAVSSSPRAISTAWGGCVPYDTFVRESEDAFRSHVASSFRGKFSVEDVECVLDERRFGEFCAARETLIKSDRLAELADRLQPLLLTLHGTNRQAMNDIVEYGYIVPGEIHPGTKMVHTMSHGNLFGDGIYSSTLVDMAILYASCDGLSEFQVLVNAVIPGRVAVLNANYKEKQSSYLGRQYVPAAACFSGGVLRIKQEEEMQPKVRRGPDGRRPLPEKRVLGMSPRSNASNGNGQGDEGEEDTKYDLRDFDSLATSDGRIIVSANSRHIVPLFRVTLRVRTIDKGDVVVQLKNTSSSNIWFMWNLSNIVRVAFAPPSDAPCVQFFRVARDLYSVRLPLELAHRGNGSHNLSNPFQADLSSANCSTGAAVIVEAAERAQVLPDPAPQHVILIPKTVIRNKEYCRQLASFVGQLLENFPQVQDGSGGIRTDGSVIAIFWGSRRSAVEHIRSAENILSYAVAYAKKRGLAGASGRGGLDGALHGSLEIITKEPDNLRFISTIHLMVPPRTDSETLRSVVKEHRQYVRVKNVVIRLLLLPSEVPMAFPNMAANGAVALSDDGSQGKLSKRARQYASEHRKAPNPMVSTADRMSSVFAEQIAAATSFAFVKNELQTVFLPEAFCHVVLPDLGDGMHSRIAELENLAKTAGFDKTGANLFGEVLNQLVSEDRKLAFLTNYAGLSHTYSIPSGEDIFGYGFLDGLHSAPSPAMTMGGPVLYKGPVLSSVWVDGRLCQAHFSTSMDIEGAKSSLMGQIGRFRNLSVGGDSSLARRRMPLVEALCRDILANLSQHIASVGDRMSELPPPPLPPPSWSPNDIDADAAVERIAIRDEQPLVMPGGEPNLDAEARGWKSARFYGICYYYNKDLGTNGLSAWRLPRTAAQISTSEQRTKKLAARDAEDADKGEVRQMRRLYFEERRRAKQAQVRWGVKQDVRELKMRSPPLYVGQDWTPVHRGEALRFLKIARSILHRLSSMAADMQVFGGVSMSGEWFRKLCGMHFGRRVARRVVAEIDPRMVEVELGLEAKSLPAAEDALAISPMRGIPVELLRSAAAEVEPWNVTVLYAGRELNSSFARAYELSARYASDGLTYRPVESDPRATDVLPLGNYPQQLSRMAHAWIITRNPFLPVPGQRTALTCVTWVTAIEQLFREFNPPPAPLDEASRQLVEQRLNERVATVLSLTSHVIELMGKFCQPGKDLLERLSQTTLTIDDVQGSLSTSYGVTSICLALGALLLPQSAGIVTRAVSENRSDPLSRLPFSMLEESISRACRAHLTITGLDPASLIRTVLGITAKTNPDEPFTLDEKRAVRLTGRFYNRRLTNCTPFALVAALGFVEQWHLHGQNSRSTDFLQAFSTRKISMGAFLRRFMGASASGAVTQIALFLHGVKFFKGHQRAGGAGSIGSDPAASIREHVDEQLAFVRWKLSMQTEKAGRVAARKNARALNAAERRFYHTAPRLFNYAEIDELNRRRSPDDQLVLLEDTGLLRDHCCYPDCPLFLADLSTANDKKAARAAAGAGRNAKRTSDRTSAHSKIHPRGGLRRHLRYDLEFANNVPSFHKIAVAAARSASVNSKAAFRDRVVRSLEADGRFSAYIKNASNLFHANIDAIWEQVYERRKWVLDLESAAAAGSLPTTDMNDNE